MRLARLFAVSFLIVLVFSVGVFSQGGSVSCDSVSLDMNGRPIGLSDCISRVPDGQFVTGVKLDLGLSLQVPFGQRSWFLDGVEIYDNGNLQRIDTVLNIASDPLISIPPIPATNLDNIVLDVSCLKSDPLNEICDLPWWAWGDLSISLVTNGSGAPIGTSTPTPTITPVPPTATPSPTPVSPTSTPVPVGDQACVISPDGFSSLDYRWSVISGDAGSVGAGQYATFRATSGGEFLYYLTLPYRLVGSYTMSWESLSSEDSLLVYGVNPSQTWNYSVASTVLTPFSHTFTRYVGSSPMLIDNVRFSGINKAWNASSATVTIGNIVISGTCRYPSSPTSTPSPPTATPSPTSTGTPPTSTPAFTPGPVGTPLPTSPPLPTSTPDYFPTATPDGGSVCPLSLVDYSINGRDYSFGFKNNNSNSYAINVLHIPFYPDDVNSSYVSGVLDGSYFLRFQYYPPFSQDLAVLNFSSPVVVQPGMVSRFTLSLVNAYLYASPSIQNCFALGIPTSTPAPSGTPVPTGTASTPAPTSTASTPAPTGTPSTPAPTGTPFNGGGSGGDYYAPVDGVGFKSVSSCFVPWAFDISGFITLSVRCYDFNPLSVDLFGGQSFFIRYYEVSHFEILGIDLLPFFYSAFSVLLVLFIFRFIKNR